MKCGLLLVLLAAACRAQTFNDVDYLYRATDQTKPEHIAGVLTFDSAKQAVTFTPHAGERHSLAGKVHEPPPALGIPAKSVTNATYEHTALPRNASWPSFFSKEKNHFLTIQYTTESGDGKYAIFQLYEANYREALAAAEATLGVKVERGPGVQAGAQTFAGVNYLYRTKAQPKSSGETGGWTGTSSGSNDRPALVLGTLTFDAAIRS